MTEQTIESALDHFKEDLLMSGWTNQDLEDLSRFLSGDSLDTANLQRFLELKTKFRADLELKIRYIQNGIDRISARTT